MVRLLVRKNCYQLPRRKVREEKRGVFYVSVAEQYLVPSPLLLSFSSSSSGICRRHRVSCIHLRRYFHCSSGCGASW
jgi:hypothetical protein